MRVLFTATAGAGHVLPMVPLARAVAERGHEVAWAADPAARPWLERAGFGEAFTELPVGGRGAEYTRRWPEAAGLDFEARTEHMFPRLAGAVAAEMALPALVDLVESWSPDLIVGEAANFAAPLVAAAADIPHVTHRFGLGMSRTLLAAAGEQAAPLWRALGLEPRPYGGCYDRLAVDICPPSLLEPDRAPPGPTVALRPAAASTGGALPERLEDFLAGVGAAPVVLLTFGTMIADPTTIGRVAASLAQLDAAIVVTISPALDQDVLGGMPDNVFVSGVVDYDALLPRCAGAVSHAGSGTVLRTLAHGIPQLCLPQAPSDQFNNANAVAAVGAGLALVQASPEAIRAAARRVLEDASLRAGALRMAAEIAAMPAPSDVVPQLEQLVAATA